MRQHEEHIPLIPPSRAISNSSTSTFTLSWSHISAEVKQQSHRLLHDLSGIVLPGQILAIMGTSGVGKCHTDLSRNKMPFYSGKTTLMNVLSGQCTDSSLTTTGEVYLNGCLTTSIQRMTSGRIGYVEQHEIFVDTMTLEEHLIFQVIFIFISD